MAARATSRHQQGMKWGPALTELLVGLICLGIAALALLWVSGVVQPPEELPSVRRPWHFTSFTVLEQWLWLAFWTALSVMVLSDAIRRTIVTVCKRRNREWEEQETDTGSASGRKRIKAEAPLLHSKHRRRR